MNFGYLDVFGTKFHIALEILIQKYFVLFFQFFFENGIFKNNNNSEKLLTNW